MVAKKGSLMRRARSKLLSQRAALARVRAAQRRGEKIVFTNGCFDLLHVGHARSLEKARAAGDRLLVALNADSSVRELKGAGRPLVPLRQRMELVASLECVDWVISFRGATPLGPIRMLRPDVLAKGADWPLDRIVSRREIQSWGGQIVRLRQLPGVRSSILIERARRGAPRRKH